MKEDNGFDWWYYGLMTLIIGLAAAAMVSLAIVLTMCAIQP